MISLKIDADFTWGGAPFVAKLIDQGELQDSSCIDDYAVYTRDHNGVIHAIYRGKEFSFQPPQEDDFSGDVVMCFPSRRRVDRLFRANSMHNALLITERCDQMCLMCSQPPRNTDDAWRFPLYEKAICLVPVNSVVCLSGGEPTLYKNELFEMLENISQKRTDIRFHILSNGQHLKETDVPRLRDIHEKLDVVWGIPLYGAEPELHEKVVDKVGSFNLLIRNLYLLGASHASIELRTVVTSLNALELPSLSNFISEHLNFISYWAIMAMEPIGFAKANLKGLFYDHSVAPQPIHKTLDVAVARGIDARLFNFPLCSVGENYREYCQQSISDWKRKYLDKCTGCSLKSECTGFFEWYGEKSQWANIRMIEV